MKKKISIIGGGPSALSLAAFLDTRKYNVTIYEKNKTLGRKFLVAGKGGFNLSYAEPIESFIQRYTPSFFLEKALLNFDNTALRTWLNDIGIETFVGSSNRIFPVKGIKPIEVLNAIINDLKRKKVNIKFEHQWLGWTENEGLVFSNGETIQSDYIVFALGGSSWSVTGSDGSWLDFFDTKKIITLPFQSSNCAFQINWSEAFIKQHEGKALKNISISCSNKTKKGEVVITQFGFEGNAIYALSPEIQKALNHKNKATIYLDLKPTLSVNDILKRLQNNDSKKTSEVLKKELKLSAAAISLLKSLITKETFLDKKKLVDVIKKLPLEIIAAAPVDEAISTSGGIALEEVNQYFELKQLPHHFCIGEMIDWNAPTGGYLLQACFSMGVYLAQHLNTK